MVLIFDSFHFIFTLINSLSVCLCLFEAVCKKWSEWSRIRTEKLTMAMEECSKVCKESKMKPEFMCCSTPIPSQSFANNCNDKQNQGSSLKSQSTKPELKEEDYVMSEEHYEKSTFPFKGRAEIAAQILLKVTTMRRANSQSFNTKVIPSPWSTPFYSEYPL